jgi:hypothetical protein
MAKRMKPAALDPQVLQQGVEFAFSNGVDVPWRSVAGRKQQTQAVPILGGPEGFATLWDKNGQLLNLGTLGGTQSLAGGINEGGQVIGSRS